MNLAQALRIKSSPLQNSIPLEQRVAFVGAGGKTAALFQLARELPPPVIVSATSHLGAWQIPLADRHIVASTPAALEELERGLSGVVLVTGELEEDRTQPLGEDAINWLHEFCKYNSLPLLVEADGARQKPLKAPGSHEPPIPGFIETVVALAGLSALGEPLDETHVHRPELFAELSGLSPGQLITPKSIARVLGHSQGGLKNMPHGARRVALLNQADTPALQSQAKAIAKVLLTGFDAVIIASLMEKQIHAVHEPIAGIILAAGEAQRFGQPKQMLDWRGEPFVRAVAKTALDSGLDPVILVTGAYTEEVELAVKGLPVIIAFNQAWQSGQASSIRAGLNALTDPLPASPMFRELQRKTGELSWSAGGGLFLLADQPQVTSTVLRALMEEHASSLAPVTAPLVLDRRANPVLFDRVTFPDLMQLEGDVGGRGIFSKYNINYLPWHDDALLLDVDTPEHYQRLKDLLE